MTSEPEAKPQASLFTLALVGAIGAAVIVVSALIGIAVWNATNWLDSVFF